MCWNDRQATPPRSSPALEQDHVVGESRDRRARRVGQGDDARAAPIPVDRRDRLLGLAARGDRDHEQIGRGRPADRRRRRTRRRRRCRRRAAGAPRTTGGVPRAAHARAAAPDVPTLRDAASGSPARNASARRASDAGFASRSSRNRAGSISRTVPGASPSARSASGAGSGPRRRARGTPARPRTPRAARRRRRPTAPRNPVRASRDPAADAPSGRAPRRPGRRGRGSYSSWAMSRSRGWRIAFAASAASGCRRSRSPRARPADSSTWPTWRSPWTGWSRPTDRATSAVERSLASPAPTTRAPRRAVRATASSSVASASVRQRADLRHGPADPTGYSMTERRRRQRSMQSRRRARRAHDRPTRRLLPHARRTTPSHRAHRADTRRPARASARRPTVTARRSTRAAPGSRRTRPRARCASRIDARDGPGSDAPEPLDDRPLADDDRVVGLVDADRALGGHRDTGDERRQPSPGRARRQATAVARPPARTRTIRRPRPRARRRVGRSGGPRPTGSRRARCRSVGSRQSPARVAGGRPRRAQLREQPRIGPVRLDLDSRHLIHEDHDGAAAHRPVHARVGLRPDEQLHRHRRRPAEAAVTASCSPPRRRWSGRLEPLGFVEDLVDLAPPPPPDAPEQDAGQFWKDFIRDTSPEFRKPTIQQLATFMQPTWQALIDGARLLRAAAPRDHRQAAARRDRRGQRRLLPGARDGRRAVRPDHVVQPARDERTRRPAGVLRACRPTIGPSGPPSATEYDRTHRPTWATFNDWVQEQGAPAPAGPRVHPRSRARSTCTSTRRSPTTPGRRPLGGDVDDASTRPSARPTPTFELPAELANRPAGSGLIYLSLGSLGSADVELMRRLVAVLGDTPHRYIVSKGPQHDQYELAPNMWGAEFLPQTRIIPLVDLVITHGGNNTTTEAFHFGKPMIVLPLFWDQYDNAQRVDETGFGVRLPTYAFERRGSARGDRPAARRRRAAQPAGRDRGGDPGEGRRREGRGGDRGRRRRRGSRGGAVTAPAAAPRLRSVRATRYVTAFREGGSLPGPRRGRRRRPVRREVPGRGAGSAGARRGVDRRRDRAGPGAARSGAGRRWTSTARSPNRSRTRRSTTCSWRASGPISGSTSCRVR